MEKIFVTKDSGKRVDFKSGMKRDTQEGKPRFDLCNPLNCPKDSNLYYRWAMLMGRGCTKYGERNWEKANSKEELERFKASASRHFQQWLNNYDKEEDHAAAVLFNIQAYEWLKKKIRNNE